MSHTPGPWRSTRGGCVVGGPFHEYSRGSAQSQVALAFGPDNADDPADEREANANLIAAAPTLLSACEAQQAVNDHPTLQCPFCQAGYCFEYANLQDVATLMVESAIEKARGE